MIIFTLENSLGRVTIGLDTEDPEEKVPPHYDEVASADSPGFLPILLKLKESLSFTGGLTSGRMNPDLCCGLDMKAALQKVLAQSPMSAYRLQLTVEGLADDAVFPPLQEGEIY